MKKLHILIDNGHGKETPGKRSPDERLMEWKWNREFAKMLSDRLTELNISNELLVEEDKDISLKSRCDRANITYKTLKCKDIDTLFISIHASPHFAPFHKWQEPIVLAYMYMGALALSCKQSYL